MKVRIGALAVAATLVAALAGSAEAKVEASSAPAAEQAAAYAY